MSNIAQLAEQFVKDLQKSTNKFYRLRLHEYGKDSDADIIINGDNEFKGKWKVNVNDTYRGYYKTESKMDKNDFDFNTRIPIPNICLQLNGVYDSLKDIQTALDNFNETYVQTSFSHVYHGKPTQEEIQFVRNNYKEENKTKPFTDSLRLFEKSIGFCSDGRYSLVDTIATVEPLYQ